MAVELLKCPHCGAALPPEGSLGVLTCAFCKAPLMMMPPLAPAAPTTAAESEPPAEPGQPRVELAGRRYVLLGRLARGEGSDVFLARREARPTELVVLKVARALEDADLLDREWDTLAALAQSNAQGAEFFARLVPQPVARGFVDGPDLRARPASAYLWRSGFIHTLEDVGREHLTGLDARSATWIWKRALELLGWVHRSGYVHGALLPQHLLIHPRDHGLALVGWGCSVRWGLSERLPALCAAARAYYPDALWEGGPATVEHDLTMAARCIVRALGGDPERGEPPATVPEPLRSLLRDHATPGAAGRSGDAWELKERLAVASRAALGPSKYQPLHMPGWR